KHLFQTLDGDYEEKTEYPEEELASTVGTVTQAEAKYVEGFTPMGISQDVVQPEGATEIEIRYNRNEYSLLFDTKGGSYIPTITGKYETEVDLNSVDEPTRTGYTFDGWYADKELTQPVSRVTLDSDKRVYAEWDGAIVDYKVVYLKENANDADYSYAGTVTLQAKAGTQVTANANTAKPTEFNKDNDAQHFTFLNSETKTVEADGSTVIQVKYTRKQYTITFQNTGCIQGKEEHSHSEDTGCYKLNCTTWHIHSIRRGCYELVCTKEEHTHSSSCQNKNTYLKITAKYGAFIGDEWNRLVGPGTKYEGSNWYWGKDSSGSSVYTSYQSTMPGEMKEMYTGNSGKTKRELFYYIETLDKEELNKEEDPRNDPRNTSSGRVFFRKNRITLMVSSSANPTFDEEFYSMEAQGYQRYYSSIKAWSDGTNKGSATWGGTPIEFFYTLKDYELALNNLANTSAPRKETVKYTASIAGILTEEEAKFAEGVFGGWYLDPECTKPYEGNKTMPMGLVLYAKKIVKTYTVEFVDSENADEKYDQQEVEAGKPSHGSAYPEKDGKIFDGWYTDPECTQKFDINSPITEDTRVYAKWRESSTINYTVRHVTADGRIISQSTVTGNVGDMVVIKAIKPGTVNPDYAEYNVPDTIQVERRLTRGENNDITITYSKLADLTYEIRYEYNGNIISELSEGAKPARAYQITIQADVKKLTEQGYQLAEGEPAKRMVSLVSDNTKNVFVFKLAPATYRITYNLDGGALAPGVTNPDSYTPAEMTGAIVLSNPSKEGYTFTGWQLTTGKVGGGNAYDGMQVEIENTSYGHLAFKATYEPRKDLTYTVNYYKAGTTEKLLKSREEENQTFGATVEVTAPEIPGYSVDKDKKSVTIQVDNGRNVIDFFYTRVSSLHYEVHYYYQDGSSTQEEVTEGDNGTYKDPIPYVATTPRTYRGKNYVLEKVEKTGDGTISTQEDQNVVKVYYTVDEKSDPDKDPDPTNPGDGIPDKYQVTITYVAKGKGTVTALEGGTVEEVRTTAEIRKNADGTITVEREVDVYPYAAVQATPDAGYSFTGWTSNGTSYKNTDEIKTQKITTDTTFTASFTENGNVTIFYKATEGGTVAPDNESLKPATGVAQGSTAQPKDGYKFVNWTDKDNNEVSGEVTFVPAKTGAVWVDGTTYTANFTKRTDLPYEVHYFYGEVEDTRNAVKEPNGTFGEKIPYTAEPTATYQEKNYTLVKIEKTGDGTVTTTPEKNVVNVYYLLDTEGPNGTSDGIPDTYQITITYVAGANGTVDGTTKEVHTVKTFERNEDGTINEATLRDTPANPVAAVTASPDPGYKFVNWTSEGKKYTSLSDIRAEKVSQNKEFQANFTAREDLGYEVRYFYDGTAGKTMKDKGILNAEIPYTAEPTDTYDQKHYTLEKVVKHSNGIITAEVKKNIVEIYYLLDVEGPDGKPDGIPDQYQVRVTYRSSSNGAVKGTLKELLTTVKLERDPETQVILSATPVEAHPQAEVTVEPAEGYEFAGWTSVSTEGTREDYADAEDIRAVDVRADKEFTANFTRLTNLAYEVHYYFGQEGAYTTYTEATELAVGPVNGTFGDKIPYDAPDSRTYGRQGENERNYTLEHIDDPSNGIITTKVTDNVVRVYYTLDAEGPDGMPDNIPDKYQITITYVAESNGAYGTVEGTTKEFHTIAEITRDPDNQTIIKVEETPAAPEAKVTPQPADGYKFVNWTSGTDSYPDTAAIQKLEISQDTTFIAYFTEKANVNILYQATKGGSVTTKEEHPAPATGTVQGSTAKADDGYRFTGWTDQNGEAVADENTLTFVPEKPGAVWVDATYTANFTERTDLHYEVHYYYGNDGTTYQEDTDNQVISDKGEFNDLIRYESPVSRRFKGKTYTLEKIEKPSNAIITTEKAKNVVNVYYLLDKDGPDGNPDGKPDKYQIRITYVAGDYGTVTEDVTGASKEFHTVWTFDRNEDGTINMDTLRNTPASPKAEVTAEANPGYQFEGWTATGPDGDESYGSVDAIRNLKLSESRQFQANFTARTDLGYEVQYFYDKVKGDDVKGQGTLDMAIPYKEKAPQTREFRGKNYMLESIDITSSNGKITPEQDKNVVKIYYTLDADGPDRTPDGTPDKWQIRITYKAGDYGQVTGTTTEFHTVKTFELNADKTIKEGSVQDTLAIPRADVTASPNPGYKFVDWSSTGRDGQQESYKEITDIRALKVSANKEFTANFTARTDLPYEVHYFYNETEDNETEDTDSAVIGKGTLDQPIPYTVERTTEYNGKKYMLERIDAPSNGTITPEEEKNVVNIHYTLDEDGENGTSDSIPDKYQIRITYKPGANGTVSATGSGTTTEFHTIATFDRENDGTISNVVVTPVKPGAEVMAKPDDGYQFTGWTSGGDTFKDVTEIRRQKVDKDTEFTANFTEQTDLHYEVHYFYDGTEDGSQKVEKNDGTFGNAISYDAPATSIFNGQNYVLEKIEKLSGGIISIDQAKNVVNIHYTLDEDGEDEKSDGTPDKYQIRITYVSGGNGTVTGKAEEFHTIKKFDRNPDGTITNVTDTPAKPAAAVTVTPAEGYKFVNWTSDGETYAKAEDIQKLSLGTSKVFTANFAGREDLKYEIHYIYGQKGSYQDYQEAGELAVKNSDGVLNTAFWQKAEPTSQYQGQNYTLEHIEKPTNGIVTAKESDNVVNIYYTLDADGPEGQPDGNPDKYQIRLNYVPGANGTVNETTPGGSEEFHTVKTFTRNPDGTIGNVTDAPATPAAAVEPAANPGYQFTNWSDGTTSYTDTDDIRSHTFMESMTFTANFTELSNVTLLYQATAGGSVSRTEESLPPATGVAQGSTAKAADGYRFVNWTDAAGNQVSDQETFRPAKAAGSAWINGTTYTANFTRRTDLKYEVHYFYDRTEDEGRRVLGTNGTFGAQIIDYTPAQTSSYNGKNYVLETVERPSGGIITTDVTRNIVNIYYTLDADGPDGTPDGTPDKFQIRIRYLAGANGSLEGTTEEVHTVKTFDRNADGTITNVQDAPAAPVAAVQAVPGDGYRFVTWTSGSDRYDSVEAIQALSLSRDTTFVASFTARTDLGYSVHYLYDGEEDRDKAVSVNNGTFGAAIPYTAELTSSFAGKNYVLERVEKPSGGIITTSIARNVVNIHYTLDEESDPGTKPDPTKPGDGIPDKYQITFTYQAAAGAHGTVTGTTQEVKTIQEIVRDKDTQEIIQVGPVTPAHPAQPATVQAENGYHFQEWSDGNRSFADDEALRAAGFTSSRTFTASFEANAQTYRVEHVDEDTNTVIETSEPKAAVFGAVIRGIDEKKSVAGYAFVRAENLTVGTDNARNIVRVYYSADTKSDPDADPKLDLDPSTPGDGIPDKYQITFTYEAAANGTVTGTTSEVKTIQEITRDPSTGAITAVSPVKAVNPTQPSTVTANQGYYFLNWSHGSAILANDAAVRAGSYTTSETFTANFKENPNNAWTAQKQVTNIPSRGYFRVGEDAHFTITVTNTGNRPLTNVKIHETLKGAVISESTNGRYNLVNGDAVIPELAVGRSVTVEATYKVTREDLFNREFRNIVVTSATIDSEEPGAEPVDDVTADTGRIPAGAQGSGGSSGGGGGGSSSGTRSPGTGGGPTGGPGT
ncbi:MAG: DUF11 domain-containing protein, partial [Lachnospiraceae bacterium]|nr:DUF11 domain-containing protein [Lachnospiraceae bacterium]